MLPPKNSAILAILIALCSCTDKAKSDLERGLAEEGKGNLPAAIAAYEIAKLRAPNSKSGQEAARLAEVVRARLGTGTVEGNPNKASSVGSTTQTEPDGPNLGISTKAFVDAWNGWAKTKYAKGAQSLSIDKLASAAPGSTAKLDFDFGMDITVNVARTGFVERVQLKVEHAKVADQPDLQQLALAGVFQGAAMDCLFAATSPGSDVDAIRRELGGVKGTSTNAVRGNVRFGFSQKKGTNEPEYIVAQPASSPASDASKLADGETAPAQSVGAAVQREHGKDSFFCFSGVRCPWNKVCCPGGREVCVSDSGLCEKATPNFQTRVGFRCNRFTNEPCAVSERCVYKQPSEADPLSATSECEPK